MMRVGYCGRWYLPIWFRRIGRWVAHEDNSTMSISTALIQYETLINATITAEKGVYKG